LAGASVVIVFNTSKSDKVANAIVLRLMEERESIGSEIESMGGVWVSTLEDGNGTITHAIWIASDEDERRTPQQQLSELTSETLVKLNYCLAMSIPVVGPNWLTKVGELSPGQHWACDVNVENHTPRVIKLFFDINSGTSPPLPSRHNHSTGSSSSRRDAAASLSASISETYQTLIDENPDVMEEEALKRAMELSMLDFAIVHHSPSTGKLFGRKSSKKNKSPHEVLKVKKDASPAEIKIAYRRRALETHPDKGGKPGEFEAVARAYRMLLAANNGGLDASLSRDEGEISLKSSAHWDTELKEHRNLVHELYQNHGQDIDDNLQRQNLVLERLGLRKKEAGSRNYNERNELIRNSCFYLSLASSYLSGIAALAVWDKEAVAGDNIGDADRTLLLEADDALIKETALQLKRVIEAAVLSAHPEWAARGMVGEEVQAFSDFLVYILESQTIISDWAVVVFDTSSGFVDVYKGQNYKDEEEGAVDLTYAASNTLTLRFVPGHYQPLMGAEPDSRRPTLKQIISVLDECRVLYVVTDGAEPEKQT